MTNLLAPELVRLAMEATGSRTLSDLARALGLTSYAAPRNIRRWIEGETNPDYDATLRLLEAAGLLKRGGTQGGTSSGTQTTRTAPNSLAGVVH
jgi:transcriptional regulator with XRE-family HTH domain